MRQARFLAPWHKARKAESEQPEGGDAGSPTVFEPTAAFVERSAIYHCISRVVGQEMLLEGAEKEHFVKLMRVYEKFCQVRVLTFCVMSNHFHILLEVPQVPSDRGRSWSDEKFLEHMACLYHGERLGEIRWRLGHYREQGWEDLAEGYREKFFARMWDLSAFMKVLKQRFTQWYNRKHERSGYLWGERFKSVLVESGHAARTVAAYIDLNPVRANMVGDPKDYRWSGYGEAVSGKRSAREGLGQVLFGDNLEVMNPERAADAARGWQEVSRAYRMILFEDGEESARDEEKNRCGIAVERVAEVLGSGGKLSEREALHCRVRHFVDGLVLGSEGFVNRMFELRRDRFGEKRKDGARRLRRVETELRSMRDLRRDTFSP